MMSHCLNEGGWKELEEKDRNFTETSCGRCLTMTGTKGRFEHITSK